MDYKKCKKCGEEKNINDFRIGRNQCRKCENKSAREWKLKNKNHVSEYNKKYFQNNKEKIVNEKREYLHEYRQTKKYKKHKKEYEKINRKKSNEHTKERYNNDYIFRLKHNIRVELLRSFKIKDKNKNKHTEEILKCDTDYFVNYLLETFKNNYGYEWNGIEKVHIDHIIPLSIAKNENEIINLCHYTNLQLLKAKDNLKKSNKY